MRLLIVEDETDLANWLLRALTQNGFVPDHAPDIRSARALLPALSWSYFRQRRRTSPELVTVQAASAPQVPTHTQTASSANTP